MADECYMLLYKWGKKSIKHKLLEGKSGPKLFASMIAAGSKDMIWGDCFEMVPFVLPGYGVIKVESFSHSMSAVQEPQQHAEKHAAYVAAKRTADIGEVTDQHYKFKDLGNDQVSLTGTPRAHMSRGVLDPTTKRVTRRAARSTYAKSKKQRRLGNQWRTSHPEAAGALAPPAASNAKKWYQLGGDKLPSHGNFSFTKRIDRATPQIAYCCASAMKMRYAWIFLRKKTGLGPPQLRLPHCMIRLQRCIVTDHNLTDSSETFQLSYKKILWFYADSLTNTGVPTGWLNYSWDVSENKGNKD